MRPISLTLEAFGPFPKKEQLDFTLFGVAPLFLINGATGAGKSTLLDAICYALYGETTGNERTGDQMRCDYAAPDQATQVDFIFELGQRRFQIIRSPEQEVPKKRGEGSTLQSHQASLYEIKQAQAELLAHRPKPVMEKIVELIGLDAKQFRQVMVIPQGQFRALLLANSKEREAIFGQLFQTQIYQKIEEELAQRAAEIRKTKAEFDQQIGGVLATIELDNAAQLEGEKQQLAPLVAQSEREYQALLQKKESAQREHQAALMLQKRFEQQQQLQHQIEQKWALKPQLEEWRKQYQQAQKAQQLNPLYEQQQRAQQQFEQAQKDEQLKKAQFIQIEQQMLATKQAWLNAVNAAEVVESLKEQRYQLLQLGEKLSSLAQRKVALDQAQQAFQLSLEQMQSLEQACTDAQQQRATQQNRLETAQQEQGQLALKQAQYLRLTEQIALHQAWQQLAVKLAQSEQELQQLETQYQAAQRQRQKAEQKADRLEWVWHSNQAAELAQRLELDHPCPVCGSLEHPTPATWAQEKVDVQQVKQARSEQQRLLNYESDLKIQWQTLHEQRQQETQRLAQQESVLREQSLLDLVQLNEQAQRLNQEIKRLSAMDISGLQAQLAHLEQSVIQQTDRLQQHKNQLDAAKVALIQAQTQWQLLQDELQHHEQSLDQTREQYRQVNQKIQRLEQDVKDLQAQHQEAEQKMAFAQAQQQSAKQQLTDDQARLDIAQRAWQQALEKSEFKDEAQFHLAQCDRVEMENLARQIRSYEDELNQLLGQQKQLTQELAGQEPPSLTQLEQAYTECEQALNAALQQLTDHRSRWDALMRVEHKLAQLAIQHQHLEAQYQIYGTLSDVASGRNASKISLHRFVLGVLLEDVLIQASERLQKMSKGRYWLKRKIERAKGNAGSGLDLMVEDAYTGKWRDVATLSGGESFMAALALALGLSDVVQSYSGGIRLDTLFIDEGFGSLDPESLDLAIQTLVDLQQGGRTIGIISHVSELKEQMAHRIDIQSDRLGSAIQLVVG